MSTGEWVALISAAMQCYGRMDTTEALRIGMIDSVDDSLDESAVISEVLSTGPCAVTAAKELTLGFDRWSGDDESPLMDTRLH